MILRGIGLIIGNYRSWYCHFFIDPIVVQLTSTGGNQTVDVMQLEAEMVALYLHKVGLILHNQYNQLFFIKPVSETDKMELFIDLMCRKINLKFEKEVKHMGLQSLR